MNPNLSAQQFFHGTVHEFQEGDVVDPAGDQKFHIEGSGEHAYASTSVSDAAHYAELAHNWTTYRMGRGPFPTPRIYRVAPVGEAEPDPNKNFEGDHRAAGWRVLGEEPGEEHFGDPEDWRH